MSFFRRWNDDEYDDGKYKPVESAIRTASKNNCIGKHVKTIEELQQSVHARENSNAEEAQEHLNKAIKLGKETEECYTRLRK